MAREMWKVVKDMLPKVSVPKTRRLFGPMTGRRTYRGKEQCVVGYSWVRPGSHHLKGLVYDCVLGWGETYDAAIAKMKERIGA